MVEYARIRSPDAEQPILVHVVDERGVRRREHPERLVQEVAEARRLKEHDRCVVTGEEHRSDVSAIRGQVEHPVIAEAVVRDRKPCWKHLSAVEGERSAAEVDLVERSVDSPPVRSRIARSSRGSGDPDLLPRCSRSRFARGRARARARPAFRPRRRAQRARARSISATGSLIYSGMLPCLRFGVGSRFVSAVSSAETSIGRVRRGSITSST